MGALNSWPHEVQAATEGAAPSSFTIRMQRFGLVPGNMMEVVQESTGDETDYEPESCLEHYFESGRHEDNDVTFTNLALASAQMQPRLAFSD
jgi:hypothetical protein